MTDHSILEQLPTLEEVEREIARKMREQRLLRAVRDALKKKHNHDQAAERLRQTSGDHGE